MVKSYDMGLLEIIFPQVRAEVLRLLFAAPDRELHLRELTRQSGFTLGTLQTEVKKLCGADLLLSRRDGNRLYFRANADHPLFADLRQLVGESLIGHEARRERPHDHPGQQITHDGRELQFLRDEPQRQRRCEASREGENEINVVQHRGGIVDATLQPMEHKESALEGINA